MSLKTFTVAVLNAIINELVDDRQPLNEHFAEAQYVAVAGEELPDPGNPHISNEEVVVSREYLWEAFGVLVPLANQCADQAHIMHAFSDVVVVVASGYMPLSNSSVAATGWEVARLVNLMMDGLVDPKSFGDFVFQANEAEAAENDIPRPAIADEVVAFLDSSVNGDYDGAVNSMIAAHKRVLAESDDDTELALTEVVSLLGASMYVCAPYVFDATHRGADASE